MSNQEPAFVAIYIDAAKMRENKLSFAVILDDNEVKCYGVSRENFDIIVKDFEIYVKAGSCKPLVYLDEGFRNTAKQMGWIIVGDL